MTAYTVGSFKELTALLKKHQRARQKRVESAVRTAAKRGLRGPITRNIPVAFHELLDTAHVEGSKIIIDAPHAAAVEVGSRPHVVPLDALVKWVKLRGMQGLKTKRQLGRLEGSTTVAHATSIAAEIRRHEQASGRRKRGSVDVNVPEQIARSIQAAIAKRGTKPSWYARKAFPEIAADLDRLVKDVFKRVEEWPATEAV